MDWNCLSENLLATGCQDGLIKVRHALLLPAHQHCYGLKVRHALLLPIAVPPSPNLPAHCPPAHGLSGFMMGHDRPLGMSHCGIGLPGHDYMMCTKQYPLWPPPSP